MRKLLLIALLLCLKQLNAQCPITISGDTVVCPGNTTTLTASGAVNYTWMPTGVNTATIAITPTANVVYTVTAVTGTCTTTNTISITLSNYPNLHFTADHPCDGIAMNFINTTANQGSITAWHWDFGDGIATSTLANPTSYTYAAAGCYSVVLTATNSAGCSSSFDTTVYIHSNPTDYFTALEACLGYQSQFVDNSDIQNPTCLNDFVTAWAWEFGDGSTANFNRNNLPDTIKHTYANCGVYNITLTVTTTNNCISEIALLGDTVYCLPTVTAPASFSLCLGAPTPVQTFTTTCAYPYGGRPYAVWFQSLNYENNTGAPPYFTTTGGIDQVPSYNAIAQNVNCNLLIDSVFAVAISGVGCIGSVDYYRANVYPTPTITPINNINACPGQTICVPAFTGCPANSTYSWTVISPIGFGTTSTGNINCYTAINPYNISITTTINVAPSANGCQGPPSPFSITVYPNPIAKFSDNMRVCEGSAMQFTDLSTPNTGSIAVNQWTWDFNNDGSVDATTKNPQYLLPTAGAYNVTLLVGTNTVPSCTAQVTEQVYINPNPVADFSGDNLQGCSFLFTDFTNLSTVLVPAVTTQYHWTFGNGNTSYLQTPPQQVYANASTTQNAYYTVSLTATTDSGCVATKTKPSYIEVLACAGNGIEKYSGSAEVNIYPNPSNGNFVIETTSPAKQTVQLFDVTGKLVLQQILDSKTSIDASSLDNGIYFVQISTVEGLFTKKIIVQK